MLMPSIFGETMLDNFFDYPLIKTRERSSEMMKTDIRDTDQGYEITMNIPGVKKEDVKAELKNGYLTVSAASSSDKEEKDEGGRYIRRERYTGSCSRSFYVGSGVPQDEIKARFEDGTLKLLVPKKENRVEENRYIAIEG